MAPLYKRYIPSKPSVAVALAQPVRVESTAGRSTQAEVPNKRKRERTDEEIAERKAKKLRKKGIEPDALTEQNGQRHGNATSTSTENVEHSNDALQVLTNSADGTFAHVKNTKKRHKLEKQARNARKLAEKSSNDTSINGTAQRSEVNDVQSLNLVGSEDLNATSIAHSDQQRQKRSKKEKKKDRATVNVETSNLGDFDRDVTSTAADVQAPIIDMQPGDRIQDLETTSKPRDGSSAMKSKKRRHKLESVLLESSGEAKARQDDDRSHLRKHGGVMSKFEKSKQLSQAAPMTKQTLQAQTAPQPVVLDLGPLPQPEKAATPEFVPDPSALPEWLAKPTTVSSDTDVAFRDLSLDGKTIQHLSKLGFETAMPVQQALIPLLLPPGTSGARFLPGTETVLPDVAVGAPTGSGKTIAYLLPMIESLKRSPSLGRLRALVVVPTRELVMQVAAVAETLARGSFAKIGIATGTTNLQDEQAKLIKTDRKYDPEGYQRLMTKAHQWNYPPAQDSEEYDEYLDDLENEDAKEEKRIKDTVACLLNHVPTYESAVDILVATPGRLLEHLGSTLGFSLSYLDWLILDEADKLIDQQYQGFLEAVNSELERPRRKDEQGARERYLRAQHCWNESQERRVRKVVLSATMTKDISKLVDLKLKRPRMILVRGPGEGSDVPSRGSFPNGTHYVGVKEVDDGFELPPTLIEYNVHAGDGSEKPLFLVQLLKQRILRMETKAAKSETMLEKNADPESDSDAEDSSSLASSSVSESSSAVTSEDEGEETRSVDAAENDAIDGNSELSDTELRIHPERAAMLDHLPTRARKYSSFGIPTVLIFTSSTEAANRLSHLLKKLDLDWSPWVHAMTKGNENKNSVFKAGATDPIITISTDRAARGLDSIANRSITHVIQYDVPRSATGYVHRVGRTARAGKPGEAWTLYTHSEARWFLNEVSRADTIKRGHSVEKVRLDVDANMQERLAEAIVELKDELHGRSSRSK